MNENVIATSAADPHRNAPVAPTPPVAEAVAPPAMTDLFGRPALLRGEDANLYDALFARVVAAARPRDPFEWILLKDYADLAWEVFRLRRAKAGLINERHKNAIGALSARLAVDVTPWVEQHQSVDAKMLILTSLKDKGFDQDAIIAEAMVRACNEVAAFEELIAGAETRRNAMLREFDYHRAGLATRLRVAPDIIDAETEDVPVVAGAEAEPA
jgi:hypothetical protein